MRPTAARIHTRLHRSSMTGEMRDKQKETITALMISIFQKITSRFLRCLAAPLKAIRAKLFLKR